MQTLLGVLGAVAGLIYASLGIIALRHLPDATEVDKTVGWTLWWFVERRRYTPAGQRLCTYGAITAMAATGCWLAWAGLR